MSELLTIKRSTAEGLADKIRAKTGKTGKMTTEQMIDELDNVNGAEPLVEIIQQNPIVTRYIEEVSYDSTDYSASRIADYYSVPTDYKQSHPVGHEVNLKSAGVLHFADETRTGKYQVAAGRKRVVNCKPGEVTHWWFTANDSVKQSGTVKATGQVRMIETSAVNVRDLGGWACDGGIVQYGLLYRGGLLTESDQDVLVGQLGICHDLDLRSKNDNEGITTSPLGNNVTYTAPDTQIWYALSGKVAEWRTVLKTIFNAAIRKEPLIFHCAAGADRTGTVACIVEALLGVTQSDMDKDYELTSFAIYHPEDLTTRSDRKRTKAEWMGLLEEINALKKGDTMRDRVANWIGNTLSFSDEEINNFRKAMISGTPEDLVIDRTAYDNLANPITSAGWETDRRLNIGSGGGQENAGTVITNYIRCNVGQVIYVKNINICWEVFTTTVQTACKMEFYDENKTRIGAIDTYKCCEYADTFYHTLTVGETLSKYTGGSYWPADTSQIRYVRFTGILGDFKPEDVIITVDQPIE